MADDTIIVNPAGGTNGDTIRTESRGGSVKIPVSLIDVGGTAGPEALIGDSGVTMPVSGTLTANIGTVGTLATAAKQDTGNTSLASIATAVAAIQTAQLPDSHNVTVDNATLAVTGTFWQATQPVSGTVTAELSATDNAVLDAIAASVAGTLTVGSHAVTNAGTFVVQVNGDALTALQLLDDVVVTLGTTTYTETTSKGFAISAVRRDADTSLVDTTNEFAPLQVDARGCLKVEVFSGETLPVSGTVDLGATDNAVLDDIAAKLGTIDNIVSGSEAQVDIVAALPAGTNTIGSVKLTDGTNTVGVSSGSIKGLFTTLVDPDGFTTAYATEDTLDQVKSFLLSIDTSLAGTLTVGSHAVTNAGTFAVQVDGSALTALQLIDDTVVTLGTTTYTEATSKGLSIGAVRRDADTTLADTTNEFAPLQVDARGCLKVEAFSGEALPITDNGGSITVDGSLTTVTTVTTVSAVTAITNALPAGTNAIGKLAANTGVDIGDVDVTSVVPGVGATNLGKQEDAAHTTGDVGVMMLGVRNTNGATHAGTTGDYSAIATGTFGEVLVGGVAPYGDPINGHPVSIGGYANSTPPTGVDNGDNTYAWFTANGAMHVRLVDASGTAMDTGLGSLRTVGNVAHDAAGTGSNPLLVGGYASAAAPSAVSTDGDAVRAWFNYNGSLNVTDVPNTVGGLSIFRTLDLDETEEDVKTSAGQVYGYYFHNAATSTRYLKFYNAAAASVTVGSTTPVMTLPLPAGASGHVPFPQGLAFSTAICVAATTALADADTGAPAVGDVILNVFYK